MSNSLNSASLYLTSAPKLLKISDVSLGSLSLGSLRYPSLETRIGVFGLGNELGPPQPVDSE